MLRNFKRHKPTKSKNMIVCVELNVQETSINLHKTAAVQKAR